MNNSQFLVDYIPDFKAWDIQSKCWVDTYFESQAANYDNGNYRLHPFSGVLDKDNNKIYHSDILLLDKEYAEISDSERQIVLVGFFQGSFMYGRSSNAYYLNTYLGIFARHTKIIGNIYEHRDLLDIDLEMQMDFDPLGVRDGKWNKLEDRLPT